MNANKAAALLRDVMKQKEGDELRSRLAAIVEHCGDAIISTSLDGIVVTWNGGAERLYGYAGREMEGKAICVVLPSDRQAEFAAILQTVRDGRYVDHFETRAVRKNGTLVEVSVGI